MSSNKAVFEEINSNEMMTTNGGELVGTVFGVLGVVFAFYTFVYGVGYANGKADAHTYMNSDK